MFTTCTDTLIARVALSLWSSHKRVEPLPVVRVWNPREMVELVQAPFELSGTVKFNRYEGI